MRTMPKLLIKLTPLEPYFFGGERIFEIDDGNKHYFIRSLDTPSQSTLFGALRYIGIKNPKSNYEVSNEDKKNIGSNSFKLSYPNVNDFGKINHISPLYLFSEKDGFLIRTPFDHRVRCTCGIFSPMYTPFDKYSDIVQTGVGDRRFPLEFNAKHGIADSWLALKDRKIFTDLFESSTCIGIDKKNIDKAFFKKEYKNLKRSFCFAFFADVDEDFRYYQSKVYLGQGKSSFNVECKFVETEPDFPEDLLRKEMVYAQSDIYYTDDIQELFNSCFFVCVQTRDYKIFTDSYLRRNKDTDKVIKLIQAGSVFWPCNREVFIRNFEKGKHTKLAGFNKIVIGGNYNGNISFQNRMFD